MLHKSIARNEVLLKPWSVLTGKASLAHSGAIVDNQSLNFVTHLVLNRVGLEWMVMLHRYYLIL